MKREYDKIVDECAQDIMWRVYDAVDGLKDLGINPEDKEAYITVPDEEITGIVKQNTFGFICPDITPMNRPTLELSVFNKLKETILSHDNLYIAEIYESDEKMYIEVKWRK